MTLVSSCDETDGLWHNVIVCQVPIGLKCITRYGRLGITFKISGFAEMWWVRWTWDGSTAIRDLWRRPFVIQQKLMMMMMMMVE